MRKSEVIHEAINVLHRDGWCKKAYTNSSGQHCILGAIATALDLPHTAMSFGMKGASVWDLRTNPKWHAFQEIEEDLNVVVSRREGTVAIDFNDEHAESIEDVLLPLKELATDYEERGL